MYKVTWAMGNLSKYNLFTKPQWIILLVVLFVGIYVRFVDLGTHFSHIDDNGVALSIIRAQQTLDINYIRQQLAENKSDGKRFFLRQLEKAGMLDTFVSMLNKLRLEKFIIIPATWTYAPLQYFMTPLLISNKMSYREILFWGRFPSFVFNILSLLALINFYVRFKGKNCFPYLIFSLVLIAFSWENIIYAKQMQSYSIGVFAAILLLLLLLNSIHRIDFSKKSMLIKSFFLAILSHAQYQILIFIPAFYMTLFIYYLKTTSKKTLLVKSFILSIISFSLLVLPMYLLFLRSNQKRGISWLADTGYILITKSDSSWFQKLHDVLFFYLKNTFIVIQSNLAFIPESSSIFNLIGFTATSLLLLGAISFFVSKSITEKYIGLFFLMLSFLWAILIFFKVLPLSPTRHSLILLPYMAILLSEGLSFIVNRIHYLKSKINSHVIVSSMLSLLIMFLFFIYFNNVVKERQDPFNESNLYDLFKRYKIDTVISYGATANLGLMFHNKDVSWNYIDSADSEEPLKIYKGSSAFKRIVLISHRDKLNELVFNKVKLDINNSCSPRFNIDNNFSDFKILLSKEINSNVELDFSSKTKNGTNGFYLYILESELDAKK